MKENQISVFIANRPGELAKVTSLLADYNINIRAISVADSSEYGMIRMVTSNADMAGAALRERSYTFVMTEVVTAEIPDRPGALSELCKKLADANVNIRYVYATVTPGGGVALAVLSTEDNDRTNELISR